LCRAMVLPSAAYDSINKSLMTNFFFLDIIKNN
jgi:hypothetical protein